VFPAEDTKHYPDSMDPSPAVEFEEAKRRMKKTLSTLDKTSWLCQLYLANKPFFDDVLAKDFEAASAMSLTRKEVLQNLERRLNKGEADGR